MVPPQCGWGRTAFGSTHEPRSTHNPLAGPPRTVSTRGPGRSSRTPAPSQRPGPRPGRGDIYSANQGRVSVNKFPEGFPGCRVFGLPGQGSGLPSLRVILQPQPLPGAQDTPHEPIDVADRCVVGTSHVGLLPLAVKGHALASRVEVGDTCG